MLLKRVTEVLHIYFQRKKKRIIQELKFITDKLPKCTSILKETNIYINARRIQYSTCKTRYEYMDLY